MTAKKATAKKTVAKKSTKTVPIRGKKGKLKGSVSLGGKNAPTAKKVVTKKEAAKKATTAKKTVPTIEDRMNAKQNAKDAFSYFRQDIIPYNKRFRTQFAIDNFVSTLDAKGREESWTADLMHNGVKVGTLRQANQRARKHVFLNKSAERAWEEEALSAYSSRYEALPTPAERSSNLFDYIMYRAKLITRRLFEEEYLREAMANPD